MPLNYQARFDASPNPYLIPDRPLDIAGADRIHLPTKPFTIDASAHKPGLLHFRTI